MQQNSPEDGSLQSQKEEGTVAATDDTFPSLVVGKLVFC